MADKRITIQIAATGAPQAAQEIERVDDAARKLDSSTTTAARSNETLGRVSNVAGAAMVGAAVGGKILGDQLAKIRDGINSIDIENLRQTNAALAEQLESARGLAELFSNPLDGIQRLISGTTISEAFAEANQQLSLNVEQQRRSIDRLVENATLTGDQIKALAREIADANRILDAKDSADTKTRDAADAARIRAGEDPDVVRADRAAFDRDQALEKINREQAAKAANVNVLNQNAIDSKTVVGDLERAGATPDQIAEAKKKAEQAQKAFEEARREYQIASQIADERRREVRAGFDATVTEAAGNREQRRARERERAEAKARADGEKLEREVAQNERTAALESARNDADNTANMSGRAFRNAGRRVGGRLGENLQDIGNELADGTSAREIARLQAQFDEATKGMGGATIAAMEKMLATMAEQQRRIENLEGQIKQSRAGK